MSPEILNAMFESYRDLGCIIWEKVLNPEQDNFKEFYRVARAFVEPDGLSNELDEELDQYINNTDEWTNIILSNLQFDFRANERENLKLFLKRLEENGY